MQANLNWLTTTGAQFSPGGGKGGCLHLANYTAEYREWGQGPPIVLVPGLAGGYELLGPLVKLLAKNHRVISYQLRGEDNCFTLRRPFELSDLVGDLREFCDALYLESPSVLGVSFGGILALEFAARFPYRLDRLIVQGTGAYFEGGLMQQVASTVLNRFPLPTDNPFVNQFFNLLFGSKPKRNSLFHFVTSKCWQTDQSVMAHRFQLVQSFQMTERLSAVRVPTLILAGDRDVLVSPRSLAMLSEGIPQSEFVRLAGCGHLAFVTHPALIAGHIEQFLQVEA